MATSPAQPVRPTIEWVMILGQQETHFKTFMDTPFSTVWKAFVGRRPEWTQEEAWQHRLYHDGLQINFTSTPETINLQSGDKVDVVRLHKVTTQPSGSWRRSPRRVLGAHCPLCKGVSFERCGRRRHVVRTLLPSLGRDQPGNQGAPRVGLSHDAAT